MEYGLEIVNGKLVSYHGSEKSVTIPEGVIRIGSGAFKNSDIETVEFTGKNLKSIDDEAFEYCASLNSILIPEGVVQIGDRAFAGCKAMRYIQIPSSVLLVGEGVLSSHNPDLIIIGEENTEAERLAKDNGLILQKDQGRIIGAVQKAEAKRSLAKTRSFDILGETITCSNTLVKYQNAVEYYANRKPGFYKLFIDGIPSNASGRTKCDLVEVLNNEIDTTVKRLENNGVITSREQVYAYFTPIFEAILGVVKEINVIIEKANQEASYRIEEKKNEVILEAESKITGLGYGIIGDSLDLIAYSIDDYVTRKKQREAAYNQAERDFSEFGKSLFSQADREVEDFILKISPILKDIANLFIERLLKVETDYLTNARIIEEGALNGIDLQKSAEMMRRIMDARGDNTFGAVLALKKYPCNVSALTYIIERNPNCTELQEMIRFLDMERQITTELGKNRQFRRENDLADISQVSNAKQGIKIIQEDMSLLSEEDISALLIKLAQTLTPKIEKLSETGAPLGTIITQEDWDFFEKYHVSPFIRGKIPASAKESYSALEQWKSKAYAKKVQQDSAYEAYLNKYPLKRSEAQLNEKLKTAEHTIESEKLSEKGAAGCLPPLLLIFLVILTIVLFVCGFTNGEAGYFVGGVIVLIPTILLIRLLVRGPKQVREAKKEVKEIKKQLDEIRNYPAFNMEEFTGKMSLPVTEEMKIISAFSGQVRSIKCKEGDQLKKGDCILEIVTITGKAVFSNEVVAPNNGTIATMNVSEGDMATADQTILCSLYIST